MPAHVGPAARGMELLWRHRLDRPPGRGGLKIGLDHAERTIAWTGGWEPEPRVQLVDVNDGRVLHREPCAALGFEAGGSSIFVLDRGGRPPAAHADPRPVRLLAFDRRGDAIEVVEREWPGRCPFDGVSRDGAKYLIAESPALAAALPPADTRAGPTDPWWLVLRAWPGGEELARWDGRGWQPEWTTETVWRFASTDRRPHGEVEIVAMDGSWHRTVRVPPTLWGLNPVGPGVMRLGSNGVRLCSLYGPEFTVVPPTSRRIPHRDIAVVGDEVCVVLAGRPRCFRVDFAAGRVVQAPADALWLARGAERLWGSALFHPTRPLLVVRRRHGHHVTTTNGEPVCQVPDGRTPVAWISVDDSLIMLGGGSGDPAIERWLLPAN